jgi:hypothetical protein
MASYLFWQPARVSRAAPRPADFAANFTAARSADAASRRAGIAQ